MTAHIAARLATIRTLLERSAEHCGYVHGEDRALTLDLRMALAELGQLTGDFAMFTPSAADKERLDFLSTQGFTRWGGGSARSKTTALGPCSLAKTTCELRSILPCNTRRIRRCATTGCEARDERRSKRRPEMAEAS